MKAVKLLSDALQVWWQEGIDYLLMLFSLSFKDDFKRELFPPAASMWEQVGKRVRGKETETSKKYKPERLFQVLAAFVFNAYKNKS